jgi:hypothetical protein
MVITRAQHRSVGDGRLSYQASVSADLADDVLRAVRVCPARAVSLSQEATRVVMARAGAADDTGSQQVWIPTDRRTRRGGQ